MKSMLLHRRLPRPATHLLAMFIFICGCSLWNGVLLADDCTDHTNRGGDAADPTNPDDVCDGEEAFPVHVDPDAPDAPPPGELATFRNWCFGVSHGTDGRFADSDDDIYDWDYAQWGYVRNMDLITGRIPPNYAPRARDVVASTSPLVPADAAYLAPRGGLPERPLIADEVDMITGSPLLRHLDLELPFGGATFRMLRTYSEGGLLDRAAYWGEAAEGNGPALYTSPRAPIGEQMWSWAGQGWMMGEAPLLLIQADYAHMTPADDLGRARCIFIPDAHHSIPFFQVNVDAASPEDMRYEAPPRFDAAISHSDAIYPEARGQVENGRWKLDDFGVLRGPAEWYVWMHDRSVKYTFAPVYDALPLTSFMGDPVLHSLHEVPPNCMQPYEESWEYIRREVYGIPFYALVTSIEDRLGNRVEIEYCDATRFDDPNHGEYPWLDGLDGCKPCAQNCGERGQIKTVRLRDSNGVVQWTLHYIYRKYQPLLRELRVGDGLARGDQYFDNQNTLLMVLVYEGENIGPDAPCYTVDPTTCGRWAEDATPGDVPWAIDVEDCVQQLFPFSLDSVYRLHYAHLDVWSNPDAAKIYAPQVRTVSAGHLGGRPVSAAGQCRQYTDQSDLSVEAYTRAPLLLQVTVTEVPDDADVERRHCLYRYAGSRSEHSIANGPVLDSVFLSHDLERLRADLRQHAGVEVDADAIPSGLHAFDEYVFDDIDDWVEKPIINDVDADVVRYLSDYASASFERWETADAGIYWDPAQFDVYEEHCDLTVDEDRYGTPWYDGACFAYSQFHLNMASEYLKGSGTDLVTGRGAMSLEDGVCLTTSRDGEGETVTRRVYRYMMLDYDQLPPNSNPGQHTGGDPGSVYRSWLNHLQHDYPGASGFNFEQVNWMTTAIYRLADFGYLHDVTPCRSIQHEPFIHDRGAYVWEFEETPVQALAPWDRPVWITVIDEYDSFDDAMSHAHHWDEIAQMNEDERPRTRRVVAMNAPGYVLWEREYDMKSGQLTNASGLWEEFHYDWNEWGHYREGEYNWVDGGDNTGLPPWKPCGRVLEHRTFGWCAAKLAMGDNVEPLDHNEPTEGLVYVYDYHTPDPNNPTLQIGARGVYDGTPPDDLAGVAWQEQYIPHPDRGDLIQHEIRWSAWDEGSDGLYPYDTTFTPDDYSAGFPEHVHVTTRALKLDDKPDTELEDQPVLAEATVYPATPAAPAHGPDSGIVYPFTIRHTVHEAVDSDPGTWHWGGVGLASDVGAVIAVDADTQLLTLREPLDAANIDDFRMEAVYTGRLGEEVLRLRDADFSPDALLDTDYLAPHVSPGLDWNGFMPAGWQRVPAGAGENAWTLRGYDSERRLVREEHHTGRGKIWTYDVRDAGTVSGLDLEAGTMLNETRQYAVRFGTGTVNDWHEPLQLLPHGEIKFDLVAGDDAAASPTRLDTETFVEDQRVTWQSSWTYDHPRLECADYDIDFSVEMDREGAGSSISGLTLRSEMGLPRRRELSIGRWGAIEREKAADGTVTRRVQDRLGRLQRLYVGSSDTHTSWGGDPDGDGDANDDLIMTEFRVYGEGVRDARLPVETRHFTQRSDAQYPPIGDCDAPGQWSEHFGYDRRMRQVHTQVTRNSDVVELTHEYLFFDHLDRPALVAEFGGVAPDGSAVDPRELALHSTPPTVDELLAESPLRLTQTLYDGLGREIESRIYDVDGNIDAERYLATRTWYDGEGRVRFTEEANGVITQTEYDGFGRVKWTATGHEFEQIGDDWRLVQLTRTDQVYDDLEQLVAIYDWTRIPGAQAGGYELDASNAVRQTTWYLHDREGRTTATIDLGVEGAVDEFVMDGGAPIAPPIVAYEPSYDETLDTITPDLPPAVPSYARATITCYNDKGQRFVEQAPDGTRTRYWYNSFGELIYEVRNYALAPVDPDAVERRAYRYDISGRLVYIAAVLPGHDPNPDPGPPSPPPADDPDYEPGAIPPDEHTMVNWAADDGTLQVTRVSYDGDPASGGTEGGEVYAGDAQQPSYNGAFVAAVHFPDRDTGRPQLEPSLRFTYYPDGSIRDRIDLERDADIGCTFRYEYDELGRHTTTAVATFPAAPPHGGDWPADLIKLVEYHYDEASRLTSATAYDGAGAVVADNDFQYDGRGNLTAELQEYGGLTVDDGSVDDSPRTRYDWAYSSASAAAAGDGPQGYNFERLVRMTYPYSRDDGYRALDFSYGDDVESLASALNLITATDSGMDAGGTITPDFGRIATYSHLGDGRRIGRTWDNDAVLGAPLPVVALDTTLTDDGASLGYTHLDRFGATTLLRFLRDAGGGQGTPIHEYTYLRDPMTGDVRACRASQEDVATPGDRDNVNSYLYDYDPLQRLIEARRGTVNGTLDGLVANEPARRIAWGLDSVGNWARDGAGRVEEVDADGDGLYEDLLEAFADAVNQRNEIDSRTGEAAFIYDGSGNLLADGDYYYVYDAWSRLIQVCGRGTIEPGPEPGTVQGVPGDWLVHYAYDGFGRLIATQRPWPAAPDEVRTTRHYYDGTRRIQDVHIDPILGQLPPGQSSIPAPGSGSGDPPDPTVNIYVAYDYIHTPGYVDELQCLVDSTGAIQHVLQDANYNVVGLVDAFGDVLAQYVYDPYGSLVAGDIDPDVRAAVGHQGLFFERLDADLQAPPFTVTQDGQGGYDPPHLGIYHNRNRTYHPQLGRFLQRDPNATGVTLLSLVHFAAAPLPIVSSFEALSLYGDGCSGYAYLAANPFGGADPRGLYLGYDDIIMAGYGGLRGAMEEMIGYYGDNMYANVEWATDWDMGDDWHTRSDNTWVRVSFALGFYDGMMEEIKSSLWVEEFYCAHAARAAKKGAARLVRSMRELNKAIIYRSYGAAKYARQKANLGGQSHHLAEKQMGRNTRWRRKLNKEKGEGPAINTTDRTHQKHIRAAYDRAYTAAGVRQRITKMSRKEAEEVVRIMYKDARRLRNRTLKYLQGK